MWSTPAFFLQGIMDNLRAAAPKIKEELGTDSISVGFEFDASSDAFKSLVNDFVSSMTDEIVATSKSQIDTIVEDVISGKREYDPDTIIADIQEAVGDDYRAEMIARTETISAVTEGQQEAWSQATDAGVLTGNELQLWVVTDDDALCPICEPMDGETAPLGEPFNVDGEDIDGPPAHPNCRCYLELTEGLEP